MDIQFLKYCIHCVRIRQCIESQVQKLKKKYRFNLEYVLSSPVIFHNQEPYNQTTIKKNHTKIHALDKFMICSQIELIVILSYRFTCLLQVLHHTHMHRYTHMCTNIHACIHMHTHAHTHIHPYIDPIKPQSTCQQFSNIRK